MRAIVQRLTLLLIFISCAAGSKPTPTLPTVAPKPPTISSNAYLLIDYHSDQILAEKNSDLVVEPASLTKMMTMYILDSEIKAGKLSHDSEILVSSTAWKAPGSRMFLNPNTKVKVSELMQGIIIQSGNDASVAVAEHIAGSEEAFAELMNSYAKMLGMKDTHFMNATGLPDKEHVTTARDMAILAKAIIKNFPDTYKVYSQKEFFYNDIKQYNRNRLLWRNEHVDGIKTGFTDSAGYCLVASGKFDHMRLIAVVMGAKSEKIRTEEANKLLGWGSRFYETSLVHSGGVAMKDVPVLMGSQQNVAIGFENDLCVTTPAGAYKKYSAVTKIKDSLKAPIKKGAVVGSYIVRDENNKVVMRQPIVALQSVEKGNIWQRGRDYVKINVKSVFNRFTS